MFDFQSRFYRTIGKMMHNLINIFQHIKKRSFRQFNCRKIKEPRHFYLLMVKGLIWIILTFFIKRYWLLVILSHLELENKQKYIGALKIDAIHWMKPGNKCSPTNFQELGDWWSRLLIISGYKKKLQHIIPHIIKA